MSARAPVSARRATLLVSSGALSLVIAVLAWQAMSGAETAVAKLARLALYLAPLPLVLALARWFPADPRRRVPGPGMLQDLIYFGLTLALRIGFSALVLAAAALWFEEHYGHLALRVGGEWPVWARVLLALLFSDFLAWFHHLLRHRIPLFWAFHQVHHSQRDMNYFTDFRLHPLDLIIANLIVLLPQLLLQVDAPTIVLLGILLQWHTVLYHCNLRTNYGPLRYLLVTPQSHRVHHSQQPEHCDRNYGVIFSIWDRIFGTQHGDAQVYPATGVDTAFPVESSLGEVLSLRALGRQMLFPFRRRPPP